jgi:hypothetical protein
MRNPLSAIMHCADAMLETNNQILSTYVTAEDIPVERRELLETMRESAHTILQCANHDRRSEYFPKQIPPNTIYQQNVNTGGNM